MRLALAALVLAFAAALPCPAQAPPPRGPVDPAPGVQDILNKIIFGSLPPEKMCLLDEPVRSILIGMFQVDCSRKIELKKTSERN